jgi:hypothetical protein
MASITILAVSNILLSCNKVAHHQALGTQISGALIYNNLSEMYKFDLEKKRSQLIFSFPKDKWILENITRISNDEYIVEDPVEGLFKINVSKKEFRFLRDGSKCVFIAEHNKILFYAKDKIIKNQYKLFIANIDSVDHPYAISNVPKTIKPYERAVRISKDIVVFIGESDTLYTYNISTNITKSEKLSINASPMVWVKSINKLLYRWSGGGKICTYSVDLKSKRIEEYRELPDVICAEYVEKEDMLIYSKYVYGFLGELSKARYELNIYSIKDKTTMEIENDPGLSNFLYVLE